MDNKAVVHRYIEEVWNQGDIVLLQNLWATDYRRYLSPVMPPLNAAEQIVRMKGLRFAFPDMAMTVLDAVEEGDKVCVRVCASCTHKGEFMGRAATGVKINIYALEIMRLQNGKIAEHWGGPDIADMLRQIDQPVR